MRLAITTRLASEPNYVEHRDAIDRNWYRFLDSVSSDIVPIIMPNEAKLLPRIISEFEPEGILLTGGTDLGIDLSRDKVEYELVNHAKARNLPLIGI